VRYEPGAAWRDALLVLHAAAHPEVRIWRFRFIRDGTNTVVPLFTPRDPGLTDAGPLVGEVMLPVEYHTVAVSLRREDDDQGRRRTRLRVDERAWREAPRAVWERACPAGALPGDTDYEACLTRAVAEVRARVQQVKPDAIACFAAPPGADDLSVREMLTLYRVLSELDAAPVLLEDPPR